MGVDFPGGESLLEKPQKEAASLKKLFVPEMDPNSTVKSSNQFAA